MCCSGFKFLEGMTQINRNDFEINVWEDFIQDYYDVERSNTQLKFIFELNEEWNSDFPELWGFWETKWFDRDELISEDYPPHMNTFMNFFELN